MYRIRSFFREFFRFLLKFDSVLSVITKLLLAAGGLVMFAFLKSPVYITIYLHSSPWYFPPLALGEYLIGILIALIIFIGIGIAITRSSNIKLHISNQLEADVSNSVMRLPIKNLGISKITPEANIQWVKDTDGNLNGCVFPVRLAWMHNNNTVHHGNTIKVDVVTFINNQIIFGFNRFGNYYHAIPMAEHLSFCIRITIPDTNIYYEKIFSLEKNDKFPFGFKAIRI